MVSEVFVYLSGPITATESHSIESNVASAVGVYFRLLGGGIPAFCPHLSAAFPTAFQIPYETWLAYDLAVIDRCTHVLMLPRWETSAGARREKQYAEQIGRVVCLSEAELCRAFTDAAA